MRTAVILLCAVVGLIASSLVGFTLVAPTFGGSLLLLSPTGLVLGALMGLSLFPEKGTIRMKYVRIALILLCAAVGFIGGILVGIGLIVTTATVSLLVCPLIGIILGIFIGLFFFAERKVKQATYIEQ